MIILRALRRDADRPDILNVERTNVPGSVVEVDERRRVEGTIRVSDGGHVHAVTEGINDGRVTGGEAGDDIAVSLAEGNLHPAVREEGHNLVVTRVEVGGEADANGLASGGVHAYIVPDSRPRVKRVERNKFLSWKG